MPRSSHTGDLIFDPEVEKTARRTRKETRQLREEHSSAASQRPESEIEPTDSLGDTSSNSDKEKGTMANARTLRELAAPDLIQQPLCIIFPSLSDNISFELKSSLIHLLPSFHGLPGEEPYKHLQKFDVVCNSMKPPGITEEQIKMRAFPFSLKDSTKDWLYYLPPGSITTDRSIIDAASGGTLVNKTPREARELIKGMAENSQQFGTREDVPIRKEETAEQVNMAGHALAPRRSYDPYSNTYNPGRKNHSNFSYRRNRQPNFAPNRQSNFVPNKQPGYQQQYQPRPPPPPSSGPSLEEMMKQMMATITQNQQRTDSEMQDIRNQMSQMATTINRLESQNQGKLPSQPELNPKNVSAMTLRSGKEVQGPEPVIPKDKDEKKIENELEREDSNGADPKVLPDPIITIRTNLPPFPSRLEKSKKQDKEKEILEVFRKVEINIPLLDAIKQVPM
ncbi:uncharacterized protein [Coffea arabica]|uniref:Uncharacterized protein n=1 Tax=Coffea arabica TaxID=13443 RepID=A0ABM4WML7_COFAR